MLDDTARKISDLPPGAPARRPWRAVLQAVAPWVSGILILVPAVGALLYVLQFGVDVPVRDEWQQIPVLQRVADGHLGWSDLFHQHNEHRLLFPRLIMLVLDRLTGFDVRAQMVAAWALLVLAGVVLFVAHLRVGRAPTWRALLEYVPVAWLLFSLRQSQNYLWGWQHQIMLCLLAALVAFALLARPTTARVWLAAAAAVVASYSFANGVIVFPIGALALLSSGDRRRLSWLGGWLAVGAATLALFLWGWSKPSHHPSEMTVFHQPAEGARYLLASQGSPFTWRLDHSLWLGAAAILLLALGAWMSRRRPLPLGTLLGLFSLGSGAVLVVGRVGFGADQALSSRYVTFTLLAAVGAYECFREIWHDRVAARVLGGLVAAGMLAAVPASVRWGLAEGRRVRAERLTMAAILPSYASLSDEAAGRLFVPPYVREKAPFLEQNGLSVFRRSPHRIDAPIPFAVEKVSHQPAEGGLETLEVSGWAVDPGSRTRPAAILVRLDGAGFEVAEAGLSRGDIAGRLNEKGYTYSGFALRMPGVKLAPGAHVLDLRVVTSAGDYYDVAGAATFTTR